MTPGSSTTPLRVTMPMWTRARPCLESPSPEDDAYIRGSNLCGHARVSDCGMVLDSPDTGRAPILSGTSAVYGRVCGDVHLTDTALIISGEEICNDSLDTLVMDGKGRSVIRDPSRDELAPQEPEPQQKGHKERWQSR